MWLDGRGCLLGRLSLVDLALLTVLAWLSPVPRFASAMVAARVGLAVVASEPEHVARGLEQKVVIDGRGFDNGSTVHVAQAPPPRDSEAGPSILPLHTSTVPADVACLFVGLRREDLTRLLTDARQSPQESRKPSVIRVIGHGTIGAHRRSTALDWHALHPTYRRLPCEGIPDNPYGTWWALTTVRLSAQRDQLGGAVQFGYQGVALLAGEQLRLTVHDMQLSCVVLDQPTVLEPLSDNR